MVIGGHIGAQMPALLRAGSLRESLGLLSLFNLLRFLALDFY